MSVRVTLPLILALILACVATSGCATLSGEVAASVRGPARGVLHAGAAKVDITPPPGFPLGGYSLAGKVARGTWTRLYARAVYLEDREGVPVVLVACDLWAIPGAVADRATELLQTDTDFVTMLGARTLGREQVLIGATHTHQSPAAFSGDPFFTVFSDVMPGFDPVLLEFLARRIAYSIALAVERAEPASLRFDRKRVGGVFRNRSFDAFEANGESARDLLETNADLQVCEEGPGAFDEPEACRAIDAEVRVLVVEATAAEERPPIAIVSFMAGHPTTLGPDAAVYNADVFGAVSRRLELGIGSAATRDTVAPVFNGAEGDVSFTWRLQDRSDVLRISKKLAAHIAGLAQAGGENEERFASPAIASHFSRKSLRFRKIDRPDSPGRTAIFPMPGGATLAGAEDGRSGVPKIISREGRKGWWFGAHGWKLGALDPSFFGVRIPFFAPTRPLLLLVPPPNKFTISHHQIGPLRIASLPGEFTTMMGMQIRRAIADETEVSFDHILLAGLSQSYTYYFATPREYREQHYEGSGTLWGRGAGALVEADLVNLAGRSPESEPYGFKYGPTFKKRFRLRISKSPARLGKDVRGVFVTHEDDALVETNPRHCWYDRKPYWPSKPESDNSRLTRETVPRVWITEAAAPTEEPLLVDGIPADDRGLQMVTLVETTKFASKWCAYWIPPEGVQPGDRHRFGIIHPDDGGISYSDAFEVR